MYIKTRGEYGTVSSTDFLESSWRELSLREVDNIDAILLQMLLEAGKRGYNIVPTFDLEKLCLEQLQILRSTDFSIKFLCDALNNVAQNNIRVRISSLHDLITTFKHEYTYDILRL